jgi:hypothetical protein
VTVVAVVIVVTAVMVPMMMMVMMVMVMMIAVVFAIAPIMVVAVVSMVVAFPVSDIMPMAEEVIGQRARRQWLHAEPHREKHECQNQGRYKPSQITHESRSLCLPASALKWR